MAIYIAMLREITFSMAAAATLAFGAPFGETAANARTTADLSTPAELPAYLQCVPYARELSGVQIYGDAHTWWKQAKDKYERGNTPQIGAVMAFRPHRKMRLGHVAAVSRVIDSRTVLLSHSNWSPINGRRGQIEDNVRAIDVSRNNDWSKVRVWYDPIQALGKTVWPVHGFIYGDNGNGQLAQTRMARAAAQPAARPVVARAQSSRQFLKAFGNLDKPRASTASRQTASVQVTRVAHAAPRRSGPAPYPASGDPVAKALAKYD